MAKPTHSAPAHAGSLLLAVTPPDLAGAAVIQAKVERHFPALDPAQEPDARPAGLGWRFPDIQQPVNRKHPAVRPGDLHRHHFPVFTTFDQHPHRHTLAHRNHPLARSL